MNYQTKSGCGWIAENLSFLYVYHHIIVIYNLFRSIEKLRETFSNFRTRCHRFKHHLNASRNVHKKIKYIFFISKAENLCRKQKRINKFYLKGSEYLKYLSMSVRNWKWVCYYCAKYLTNKKWKHIKWNKNMPVGKC